MLKNKKLYLFTVILILGLLLVLKVNDDMPEDKKLSSGYSYFEEKTKNMDNYANLSNYTYHLKKSKEREKTLTDKKIDFLKNVDIFAQVDTKESREENNEFPQGLCFTEEYICISSYSKNRENIGKIKIFDRTNGKLMLTLGMDEGSHLGGLAYDGDYLWVCNSLKMSIEKISYEFIQEMIDNHKGKMIDARNLVDRYRVKNIPSAITYYDNKLWVISHSIWTKGIIVSYDYNEKKNSLSSLEFFWSASKAQGVAFTDDGQVYLSTSYGRTKSSYIKRYRSISAMNNDVDNYLECIELPPCSEGIVYKDKKIYVLFESAARMFLEGTDGKGKSLCPLDRILIIEE